MLVASCAEVLTPSRRRPRASHAPAYATHRPASRRAPHQSRCMPRTISRSAARKPAASASATAAAVASEAAACAAAARASWARPRMRGERGRLASTVRGRAALELRVSVGGCAARVVVRRHTLARARRDLLGVGTQPQRIPARLLRVRARTTASTSRSRRHRSGPAGSGGGGGGGGASTASCSIARKTSMAATLLRAHGRRCRWAPAAARPTDRAHRHLRQGRLEVVFRVKRLGSGSRLKAQAQRRNSCRGASGYLRRGSLQG